MECNNRHQACAVESGEAPVNVCAGSQDREGVDIGGKIRLALVSLCCDTQVREMNLDVEGRVEVDHRAKWRRLDQFR